MTQKLTANGRGLVARIAITQSIVAVLGAVFVSIIEGKYAALSFLMGTIASIVPALIMGLMTFKYAGGNKNNLVVKSFNAGNKLKFLFTVVIVAVSYHQPFLQFGWFLMGLIIAMLTQWLVILRGHSGNP